MRVVFGLNEVLQIISGVFQPYTNCTFYKNVPLYESYIMNQNANNFLYFNAFY